MTNFALRPDIQFQFYLAHELKITVAEIKKMNCVEFFQWGLFFKDKWEKTKKAMDKARKGAKNPRMGRLR